MKYFVVNLIACMTSFAWAGEVQLDDQSKALVIQQLQMTSNSYFKKAYFIENTDFKYRRPTTKDLTELKNIAKNGTPMFFQCESNDSKLALCRILLVETETFNPTIDVSVGVDISDLTNPKVFRVIEVIIARSKFTPRHQSSDCESSVGKGRK